MDDQDTIKIVIGLASAFTGWMLAQFTSVVKSWFQQKKIKRLLIEELRDIEKQVERLQMFLSRQLQILGAQGVGNTTTIGISNPIFKN